jgi:hypothetical protein
MALVLRAPVIFSGKFSLLGNYCRLHPCYFCYRCKGTILCVRGTAVRWRAEWTGSSGETILTRENLKLWKNLFQCHYVYHRWSTDCPGQEPCSALWDMAWPPFTLNDRKKKQHSELSHCRTPTILRYLCKTLYFIAHRFIFSRRE